MEKYTETELYKYLTKEQNNNIFDISDLLIPLFQKLGFIVNDNFFNDVYSDSKYEVIICKKNNAVIELYGVNNGELQIGIYNGKYYKFIDDISFNNILNFLDKWYHLDLWDLWYLHRKEKLDYIQSL